MFSLYMRSQIFGHGYRGPLVYSYEKCIVTELQGRDPIIMHRSLPKPQFEKNTKVFFDDIDLTDRVKSLYEIVGNRNVSENENMIALPNCLLSCGQ